MPSLYFEKEGVKEGEGERGDEDEGEGCQEDKRHEVYQGDEKHKSTATLNIPYQLLNYIDALKKQQSDFTLVRKYQ